MSVLKHPKIDKLEQSVSSEIKQQFSQEELFSIAPFDEAETERTGAGSYSYWRSTLRAFRRNKIAMFLLIMLERLIYGRLMSKTFVLGHIYIPLVIGLSWIFFITPNPGEAMAYFQRLAGGASDGFMPGDWLEVLGWCWPYLAMGVVMSTPLPSMLWKKISSRAVTWVLLFALFWVCMYFMGTAASDPFLYFSF
jgi:hypothetical protein